MSKQSRYEVLLRTLTALMAGSLIIGWGSVMAQGKGKGKPPDGPDQRFEVRYVVDPGFNFFPDGEGLFVPFDNRPPPGPVCSDCPYVDGGSGWKIVEEDGGFKQIQQRDEDLHAIYYEIYETNSHYRHFSTDIEYQAIEGNLCPNLLDPDSDWTLGGGYNGEPLQRTMFSLWVDVWPDETQPPSWSTGWARIRGMEPLDGVLADFDNDGELEELLTKISPTWELVWDELEYPGTTDLLVTPTIGGFQVESLGQAMLRVKRPNGGRYRNCGLVDARFEMLATPIP